MITAILLCLTLQLEYYGDQYVMVRDATMNEDTEGISYQCCFCGNLILPAGSDPVYLEDGGTQGLAAHAECLRRALHPSVPLGVDGVERGFLH